MIIYVKPLDTTLTQEFKVENNRVQLAGLKPHLYFHNAPAGTFTMTLKNSNRTIASTTFTAASVKTELGTANDYFHIYKLLSFEAVLLGTYELELSASGYTFAESSYIGWIKDHENIVGDTYGGVARDSELPYTIIPFSYNKSELTL